MRKNIAFVTILATSLASYAASAQPEGAPPAAPPPEGAPPAAAPPEGAPPAAEAPAPAPAPAPAAAPAGYPDEYALRPLTLSAGMFQGTLPVVLNLSKNAALKPVWIPIELAFGATNELTVFVSHNVVGQSNAMLYPGVGGGLCLGGKDRNCEKVYNNLNVGGMYSLLKSNGVELAGLLALDIRRFSDPMELGVDVGVPFKYVAAPVSVKLVPQVDIGVNKRSQGNKEILSVPLQVAFQAMPQLAIFLDAGIIGKISHFSDNYTVPLGIGADFLIQHGLDVGLEFGLPMVAATSKIPSDAKGFNDRTLMLYAAWRSM